MFFLTMTILQIFLRECEILSLSYTWTHSFFEALHISKRPSAGSSSSCSTVVVVVLDYHKCIRLPGVLLISLLEAFSPEDFEKEQEE